MGGPYKKCQDCDGPGTRCKRCPLEYVDCETDDDEDWEENENEEWETNDSEGGEQ